MKKKGYLFIANSTKPSKEQSNSREPEWLSNVERWPVEYALNHGLEVFVGINRNNAEEVVSADGYDIHFYDQHTYRNIFAFYDNWVAFKNLRKLLLEHPEIEIIHCNTPLGGFMGRVCGYLYGVKTVIYTAHGFHFYKGAPLFNRTILKWVEQLLAHWTDAIITMNKEDYEAAQKFSLRENGKVFYVPGVGVDTKSFEGIMVSKEEILESIGIPHDAVIAIVMGDVIPRKNYKTAIEAIAKANRPQLHYLICGIGDQISELKSFTQKLRIDKQVHFLGFRNDIKQLTLASDFFLFSSLQEGLPRSTMEAMCAGIPCILSAVRGNIDLIGNKHGGLLCSATDSNEFALAIQKMVDNPLFRKEQGAIAKERIKDFDIGVVRDRINEIYNNILENR